jgi:eukaryotic-like serine/threonine-protein kinase
VSQSSIRIPQPGEVLAGKYRLTRLLGEGGMGMVLEAEHLRLRQPIAIKFLNPNMLGVNEIVQRFDREARAAATLRSRHVVRVTDVEQTPEGVPYMVMELLDGFDLETARETRGRLPYGEAVDYVLQACGALAEAHDAGIVHRDLKPGNLFLAREDADRVIVKVLDFGISKFMRGEDAKLTSAGAIMGTALYMSPEQIRGDMSIDARSDIWSIGVILYELIGGHAPWTGATTRVAAGVVSEAAPDIRGLCPIPEPLAQAIHAMLEKDPARRPQSISDVVFAIAPYAPVGTVGAEVADHLARRSQRNLGNVQAMKPITAVMPGGKHPTPNPAIHDPQQQHQASDLRPSSPSLPIVGPPSSNPSGPVQRGSGSGPTGRAQSQRISAPTGPSNPSSDRIQLVISTRANPERSTMAATTTGINIMAARPKIWGALAGFGVLAVAGVILILFVARSKTHQQQTNVGKDQTQPPASTAVLAPDPTTPATATTSTAAVKTAEVASATTAPPPKPTTTSVGIGVANPNQPPTTKRPPTPPPTAPTTTGSTKPAGTGKAGDPTQNPINPPFLK